MPATRRSLSLTVNGRFAAGLAGEADNLVLRAARALAAEAGVPAHARLVLEKHLPVASGIGGGSADAAAALRLLMPAVGLAPDPAPCWTGWRCGSAPTCRSACTAGRPAWAGSARR